MASSSERFSYEENENEKTFEKLTELGDIINDIRVKIAIMDMNLAACYNPSWATAFEDTENLRNECLKLFESLADVVSIIATLKKLDLMETDEGGVCVGI